MSEISSIDDGSFQQMDDDHLMDDDAGEEDNGLAKIIAKASHGNNDALRYLQRGQVAKAWERLERAAKDATTLLGMRTTSTTSTMTWTAAPAAPNHDVDPTLGQTVTNARISIILIPGSFNLSDAAFVLRNSFLMEDPCVHEQDKEILVSMILYNMAFLLHLRGLNDRHSLWKRNHDLKRSVLLYQTVLKLSACVQLEHPVFKMAALNNLGQIHHLHQEYGSMNQCWTELATILADLPPSFSLLNTRSMQLNIQLKDRIDPSIPPVKKKRSS